MKRESLPGNSVLTSIKKPPAEKKTAIFAAAAYSGPLPDASQFQAYEMTLPGAADRIIKMAEKESEHRHKKEDKALNGMIWNERLGMLCAFILSLLLIVGGFYVVLKGNTVGGTILTGMPIAVIAIAFIRGRKNSVHI
jgi:uncharacterized membrane protein